MANLAAAAIVTRLREVIADGYGTARTIAASTYLDDAPPGLDEVEDRRRALVAPIVRINITGLRRSPASPPIYGNFLIYDGEVEVEVTRTATTAEQLDDTSREALEAASAKDADVLRQALEYPGNLTTTAAGTATDIASGMLMHEGSTWRVSGDVNSGAQSYVSTHKFTGKFFARPS